MYIAEQLLHGLYVAGQLLHGSPQLRMAIAGILEPQQSEGSEASEPTQCNFHHRPHLKISVEREARQGRIGSEGPPDSRNQNNRGAAILSRWVICVSHLSRDFGPD